MQQAPINEPKQRQHRQRKAAIHVGGDALHRRTRVAQWLRYDIVFAGIPYQDPTPDLQARYAFHRSIAG